MFLESPKSICFEGDINKILTLQFWDRTSHLSGYSMASNLCALSATHDASIPDPGQDLPRRTLLRAWVTWSRFGPGKPQEIRWLHILKWSTSALHPINCKFNVIFSHDTKRRCIMRCLTYLECVVETREWGVVESTQEVLFSEHMVHLP
jgi:hypothetical protein